MSRLRYVKRGENLSIQPGTRSKRHRSRMIQPCAYPSWALYQAEHADLVLDDALAQLHRSVLCHAHTVSCISLASTTFPYRDKADCEKMFNLSVAIIEGAPDGDPRQKAL
jgi:hypothetical protein